MNEYPIYVRTGRGHDFSTGVVKANKIEDAYVLALNAKTPTPSQLKSITAFYVAGKGFEYYGYDEDKNYKHSINVHDSHARWINEYTEANKK